MSAMYSFREEQSAAGTRFWVTGDIPTPVNASGAFTVQDIYLVRRKPAGSSIYFEPSKDMRALPYEVMDQIWRTFNRWYSARDSRRRGQAIVGSIEEARYELDKLKAGLRFMHLGTVQYQVRQELIGNAEMKLAVLEILQDGHQTEITLLKAVL